MKLERLVVKIVQGLASHDKEFSVCGNQLKSFRQESDMIDQFHQDHRERNCILQRLFVNYIPSIHQDSLDFKP